MSKRLEKEVWALDNCAGCGMCVAACSKQVLGWQQENHPVIIQRTKTVGYTRETLDSCSFCQKFCEEACPRLERWQALDPQAIYGVRARGPFPSGQPNHVIHSILAAGRNTGLIDGAILLDLDPWDLKPVSKVATTIEEMIETMGPQYLWAPVLDSLNDAVYGQGIENLAVVGTPCVAQAIRRLRASANPRLKPYQDAIRLTISIFCTGIYRPELIQEVLVRQMEIPYSQVKRLEVSPDRERLDAVLWDGTRRSMPRAQAELFTRTGCGSCDDALGESADLAIGTLGAPENHSTLIVRSNAGEVFVRNALQMKLLERGPEVNRDVLAAAAGEKDRRERAQAFDEMRIVMLDALTDPYQHGEAIRLFTRLYRTPPRAGEPARSRSSCTGC